MSVGRYVPIIYMFYEYVKIMCLRVVVFEVTQLFIRAGQNFSLPLSKTQKTPLSTHDIDQI